jgi:hypothetical protein
MPLKVFISYRRQDTAASAIGIGQYLEKEFGRKNGIHSVWAALRNSLTYR